MKVILLRDVPGLGKAGDLKTVSSGYGRNYLVPKGLAVFAVPSEISNLKERQRLLELRREEELRLALDSQKKIESMEMRKVLTAGEEGEAFGSVRKEDIVEFLQANGIEIQKNNIALERPIKKDGEYFVPVILKDGVPANLKIIVEISPQS
jgi:large subunit ribosomal protein L9